jgi:hypothetical protein
MTLVDGSCSPSSQSGSTPSAHREQHGENLGRKGAKGHTILISVDEDPHDLSRRELFRVQSIRFDTSAHQGDSWTQGS